MKNSLAIGLLAVVVAAMAVAAIHDVDMNDVPFTDEDLESEESMWSLYQRWRNMYASSPFLDATENERRFEAFKENAKYVNEFNKKEGMTYELGLNKFADLTLEEFLAKYTGSKVDAATLASFPEPVEEEEPVGVPTAWDWRQRGAVTPVKDQGSCGSCWAFSSVGAVESTYAIATKKKPVTLSEQQVLDCSGGGDCNGGYVSTVLSSFAVKKGIALSQSYPRYSAAKMACRTTPRTPVVKMDGAASVPSSNEAALKLAVYTRPVSVLIEADKNFQLYKAGVYSGPCGTKVNHAVLAVGYGVAPNNIKYWIVKNSWNTNWGESGYIRMKREITDKRGLCGIAMYGMYPTKKSAAISMVVDSY
ncbi:stem bromelain-like [Oryza brachyantha]|uniref:Uncharacterized protein n=1 Tax=Oryza brachyantha TaxID=4533 RepID=J3N066_ORYBR|nr:stem bromelain-like [Oryza brachyantha]